MKLRHLAVFAAFHAMSFAAMAEACPSPCETKAVFDPSLPVLPGPGTTPEQITAALAALGG